MSLFIISLTTQYFVSLICPLHSIPLPFHIILTISSSYEVKQPIYNFKVLQTLKQNMEQNLEESYKLPFLLMHAPALPKPLDTTNTNQLRPHVQLRLQYELRPMQS